MSSAGPAHPPTSKKKQSLMPSTVLRRRLRAHGHGLKAVVRIGKQGLTPALLRQLTQVLFDHELCKVKLESESPVDRFVAAESLAEQPGFNVVQILGRTILLYKRHPQFPRYEGRGARSPTADREEPVRVNSIGLTSGPTRPATTTSRPSVATPRSRVRSRGRRSG